MFLAIKDDDDEMWLIDWIDWLIDWTGKFQSHIIVKSFSPRDVACGIKKVNQMIMWTQNVMQKKTII